jgi:hypothetical protein
VFRLKNRDVENVNSTLVRFDAAETLFCRKGTEQEQLMRDQDVQSSGLTRRRVLSGMGVAGLALMSSPASAHETVDLHVPGGPSARVITASYPQKGRTKPMSASRLASRVSSPSLSA